MSGAALSNRIISLGAFVFLLLSLVLLGLLEIVDALLGLSVENTTAVHPTLEDK